MALYRTPGGLGRAEGERVTKRVEILVFCSSMKYSCSSTILLCSSKNVVLRHEILCSGIKMSALARTLLCSSPVWSTKYSCSSTNLIIDHAIAQLYPLAQKHCAGAWNFVLEQKNKRFNPLVHHREGDLPWPSLAWCGMVSLLK